LLAKSGTLRLAQGVGQYLWRYQLLVGHLPWLMTITLFVDLLHKKTIHISSGKDHKLIRLLKSLEHSDDLVKGRNGYQITNQAARSLDQYDENERRHKEVTKQARLLSWLTGLLFFSALLQVASNLEATHKILNGFAEYVIKWVLKLLNSWVI
jgi:hypothetical protein